MRDLQMPFWCCGPHPWSPLPTICPQPTPPAVRHDRYWPLIYETQGSYASRVIRRPDGRPALTELGKMLAQGEADSSMLVADSIE